ncbi:hypothetical protein CHCC14820_0965 [Bacillus paralicheniformis]|uniref:Uncharacterized protein n=1 Tax=Bacillus paralicheniformis TaxID=1648923 RepID=A0ABY3G0X5_9BACI|nr:hypothetical protein SC10_B2orf00045 [Bacillus paralicheniformis]OLG00204.1 hypothetical protein B4125_4403 [Bacillus paralicheniformis]OLG10467.1 hypothetical protein B4123_3081 [Bacillus paralicheniformis]TWJ44803.1 hypothetical protein CHCC5027_3086 [Bacillus paralicheniformis]TWJ53789.1 hypothetical protein CHCC5023_1337 [Bacillus paralicheniformis]
MSCLVFKELHRRSQSDYNILTFNRDVVNNFFSKKLFVISDEY